LGWLLSFSFHVPPLPHHPGSTVVGLRAWQVGIFQQCDTINGDKNCFDVSFEEGTIEEWYAAGVFFVIGYGPSPRPMRHSSGRSSRVLIGALL
jgi:hypothetical protein